MASNNHEYTRYNRMHEPFTISTQVLKDVAAVTIGAAASIGAMVGVNTLDATLTNGLAALGFATFMTLMALIVATVSARWLFTRNQVSNSNLERRNGDEIFRFLGVSTLVGFVLGAATLGLEIADIHALTLLTEGWNGIFNDTRGLVGTVLNFIQ